MTTILGLQCRHRIFELTIFWIKLLHEVNNPFLNAVCKFQVGIPINERVTEVQSLENLHTFVLRQPCSHQPIFPYNIIEHSQTSLALTLFTMVQMTSNLIYRHIVCFYRPYQNLGQIDRNLHDHVFGDVVCKPPIHKGSSTLTKGVQIIKCTCTVFIDNFRNISANSLI